MSLSTSHAARYLRSSRWLGLVLLPLSVFDCSPDERRILESSQANVVAGAGAGAGTSSGQAGLAEDSTAGEGGDSGSAESPSVAGSSGSAGSSGAGGAAGGVSAGSGGTPIIDPGGSGTVSGGGTAGASGANNSGSAGVAAGAGGAPFDSPCGDIDNDSVDDCTETLVLNSHFDTDAAQWVAAANAVQAWDARDARSKSGSGSLMVTNQAPTMQVDASVIAGTEQCIAVTEAVKYEFAAHVMIPDGQGAGEAGLNLYAFAGDACSGVFLTGLTPGMTKQTGSWVVVEGQLAMPAGARSVVVRLVASKPFKQDKLSALFDDVLVRAVH